MTQIVTRFAPSPTGHLHIGGARTALFNWLYARRLGGKFVLRIEDTDALRSTDEYTQAILSAMTWLGLDWDGELTFQSKRADLHREYIQKLIDSGQAYWCHCTPEALDERRQKAMAEGGKPKYDGLCREKNLGPAPGAVVRFKTPQEGQTGWNDLVKGPVQFENSELDDLIILKSTDNMPTYNLAVVVDDITMSITQIIRGDDHVNNTPRQILLYKALGAKLPEFGHVPMILGADKTRLSKRHGATSVMSYKEMGFLPQALNNYLVRLGWSHGDQEIFSIDELKQLFNLDGVGRAPGVFNPEKLTWLNSHYIKATPPDELAELVWPYLAAKGYEEKSPDLMRMIMLTVQERGKTLPELAEKAEFYFQALPVLDQKAADKFLTPDNKAILTAWQEAINKGEAKTQAGFEGLLTRLAEERGIKLGAAAQPLRVALTGQTASPGLFEILEILSPAETSARIEASLKH